MKKYFVGLCWNEGYKPYFHLKDYESGLDEFIDIPQELLIERINQKICVGTINPYTREYVSCNNTVEDSIDYPVSLHGSLWYRTDSWTEIEKKANEIFATVAISAFL